MANSNGNNLVHIYYDPFETGELPGHGVWMANCEGDWHNDGFVVKENSLADLIKAVDKFTEQCRTCGRRVGSGGHSMKV